jgi:hypothetical protein
VLDVAGEHVPRCAAAWPRAPRRRLGAGLPARVGRVDDAVDELGEHRVEDRDLLARADEHRPRVQ